MRHLLRALVVFCVAAAMQSSVSAASRTILTLEGQEIVVLRDTFGVPHVFAPAERGVYYGNGYVVAQDRMAQMEKYRRAARGEMAELVGPSTVEADTETRREGYTEAEREAQLRALPEPHRAALQAYADGVNAFLAAMEKDGAPAEVKKLGVTIRPWKATDSLAIGQMMARRFGGDDGGELRNLQLLKLLKLRFGDQAMAVFDDLLWSNDPAAPTTIPVSEGTLPGQQAFGRVPLPHQNIPSAPAVLERAERRLARVPQMELARTHGLPTRLGSYAIAVAPGKSASGNAVLIGGPQMGFATPQIAQEIHLVCPGLDVIGMGFAGLPFVLIGRNERLAWSTTTGVGDQTDIFVEELNPAKNRQYRFKGQWRDMEKRTETIAVRGAAPATVEVYRTVHGPVVSFDEEGGRAYSQAATYWGRENEAMSAIYAFNRARTIQEFGAAAAKIASSHNWLCATQDGDIGYWYVGRSPIRAAGIDPRLPTPGTGEFEWQGTRPFAEMPQLLNPRQGFLANWNNKPAASWANSDTPVWGAVHRVQRIFDLLAAKRVLSMEDLKAILPDIGLHDTNAPLFKPFILAAVKAAGDGADERLKGVGQWLEKWDNRATDGSVAKTLLDAWLREARLAIFGDEVGVTPIPAELERALQPSLILRVLQGAAAGLPLSRDYLNGKSAADVSLEALRKSLDRLTTERGPEMTGWTYAQPRTRLTPLPDIPAYNRGTYLLIAELAKPQIRSESVLPPGQSEDPSSPHYRDQRELAAEWQYKPLVTDRETLERLAAPMEGQSVNVTK